MIIGTSNPTVIKTLPEIDSCTESAVIEFEAIDDCGKSSSITQNLVFQGGSSPTIHCPSQDTLPASGGILEHVINYGSCYNASDVNIKVEATCTSCALGTKCDDFVFESNGGAVNISSVDSLSTVEWTATMDYGCGTSSITCSVEVPGPSKATIIGEPSAGVKSIKSHANGDRWGWYEEFTFAKTGKHPFVLWASAAKSNEDNEGIAGVEVGKAIVSVSDCASSPQSTVEWDIPGTTGLCVDAKDEPRHVHVGSALPTNATGVSFSDPSSYSTGCCKMDETCYIIVYSKANSISCGTETCPLG